MHVFVVVEECYSVSVSVLRQHKELIEEVRCSLYTVNILQPWSLHNRILRAIIDHSVDCSEIFCAVPWCYFFSRRYIVSGFGFSSCKMHLLYLLLLFLGVT